MAIVKRTEIQSQVVKKLDMKTQLPKKRYTLVCKKESFVISKSSKNPMVVREWELVAPEELIIGGIKTAVAGTEFTQYLPLKANANPQKGLSAEQATANCIERYLAENAKLGLNSESVDTENPELAAEGKVVEAICNSKDSSPTEDPEEEGGKREPIYDPETNKPIERYQPNLSEILGLSKTKIGQAF